MDLRSGAGSILPQHVVTIEEMMLERGRCVHDRDRARLYAMNLVRFVQRLEGRRLGR